MTYTLKNCRTGGEAVYKTTVEITEREGVVTFRFVAENSKYYCCGSKYNDIHSAGDACEVLIGSHLDRLVYHEIEISPEGQLMLARICYNGVDIYGKAMIDVELLDECFVEGSVERFDGGYVATVSFNLEDIMTGPGQVFFNAYRLETDGGECEKHLFALNPTRRPRFHVPVHFLPLKEYL